MFTAPSSSSSNSLSPSSSIEEVFDARWDRTTELLADREGNRWKRRLDSIARLIENGSICGAIAIDGDSFLIATNSQFPKAESTRSQGYLLIDNVMTYFQRVANKKDGETELKEVFKEICRGATSGLQLSSHVREKLEDDSFINRVMESAQKDDFRGLRDYISECTEAGHGPQDIGAAFVLCSALLKDLLKVDKFIRDNRDNNNSSSSSEDNNSQTQRFISAIKKYNKSNIIDGERVKIKEMHAEMRILSLLKHKLVRTKEIEYKFCLTEDQTKNDSSSKNATSEDTMVYLEKTIDDKLHYVIVASSGEKEEGNLDVAVSGDLTKEVLEEKEGEILENLRERNKYENYIGISKLCCIDCHAMIYGVNNADGYRNKIEIRGAHNVDHIGNWNPPFNITTGKNREFTPPAADTTKRSNRRELPEEFSAAVIAQYKKAIASAPSYIKQGKQMIGASGVLETADFSQSSDDDDEDKKISDLQRKLRGKISDLKKISNIPGVQNIINVTNRLLNDLGENSENSENSIFKAYIAKPSVGSIMAYLEALKKDNIDEKMVIEILKNAEFVGDGISRKFSAIMSNSSNPADTAVQTALQQQHSSSSSDDDSERSQLSDKKRRTEPSGSDDSKSHSSSSSNPKDNLVSGKSLFFMSGFKSGGNSQQEQQQQHSSVNSKDDNDTKDRKQKRRK